jgi:hypothetical protein
MEVSGPFLSDEVKALDRGVSVAIPLQETDSKYA